MIRVVLRNPLNIYDTVDYTITPNDSELARDWVCALQIELQSGRQLEKNFCFMGFPQTARTLNYLCAELADHIEVINDSFADYQITDTFTPATVIGHDYADHGVNHETMNYLHNHFERLQGTVWELSPYYKRADYRTKYAIRQLNNICHEIETLILSRRKFETAPYWVRPSQITTFLQAQRYDLKNSHRQGFLTNGYDRVLGGVYMHWTQIGKTLFEVFRDEGAPELTETVCEAITELRYYSGEFDVEWGNDVTMGGNNPWHNQEQIKFKQWLTDNGRDPTDTQLSLGYLPLGQIELKRSFGTTESTQIWNILGSHLDIYQIEANGVTGIYDYCWSDPDYIERQIETMKTGYDYSSRG
jgi:hypothetical protein